jgi:hypothetical protein
VEQEDLSPEISTIDRIRKIYTGKIEIVKNEDIIKAIEDKTPNAVIRS